MANFHILMTLHGVGTRYMSLGDGRVAKLEPGDKIKVKCEGSTCPICRGKKFPKTAPLKNVSEKTFTDKEVVPVFWKETLTLKEQVKPGAAVIEE